MLKPHSITQTNKPEEEADEAEEEEENKQR
jgi:hypothetical protein